MKEALRYIEKNYPHDKFPRCLEYVSEKMAVVVGADLDPNVEIPIRLNVGI